MVLSTNPTYRHCMITEFCEFELFMRSNNQKCEEKRFFPLIAVLTAYLKTCSLIHEKSAEHDVKKYEK